MMKHYSKYINPYMEKILNMYVAGYSQKEIAKTLGCTSVAIAKKIQEFRKFMGGGNDERTVIR